MQRLVETRADLVFTDWNMPVMDGIEFVQAIRAHRGTCDIPVLMITTHGSVEKIDEALSAGASDLVIKPFTAATMQEKIESILAR